MSDLINLHLKNKYYIEVSKRPNGCEVKTPSNIFFSPQHLKENTSYNINRNILSVNDNELVVPNYASRIVILTDILMKMTKLGIPINLLLFFDGMIPKKSLIEILSPPLGVEDQKKDAHMFQNISTIMLGGYDSEDAKKNGVATGFNLIYDICAKGGI